MQLNCYTGGVHAKQPVPKCKLIQLKGKQVQIKADATLTQQFEDQWACLNKPFDAFRDKYRTYRRNCKGTPYLNIRIHSTYRPVVYIVCVVR